MRLCAMLAACVLAPAAAGGEKGGVRKLDLTGVTLVYPEQLTEPKPVEIKSADELAKAKAFGDANGRDAVKKQIDFAKEKLVVFVWAGSGQDRLKVILNQAANTETTARYFYQPGATDDFVRHAAVFAIPKDVTVAAKK
jgi:hypothetical protein